MTKKTIKMIALMLLSVVFVASLAQGVLAAGSMSISDAEDLNGMYASAKDDSGAATAVNSIIGSIITIVQVVGTGVAIIMLIVLAIKYISAAPGDKADIKKHAVVYVVGAIVLFAATGILQIVKNFAGNVNDAASSN